MAIEVSTACSAPELVPGLWEIGPGGPRLLASRCERCDSYAFPRRTVCPRCKLRSMAPTRLGQRGVLYSFTVCHAAPTGWEAPYLQAYVELPEGLRIFSLVSREVPARADALRPGMEMELVVEEVHAGADLMTHKYRPAHA